MFCLSFIAKRGSKSREIQLKLKSDMLFGSRYSNYVNRYNYAACDATNILNIIWLRTVMLNTMNYLAFKKPAKSVAFF